MQIHLDRPGPNCRYRLFEWISTAMMLGIGVCILLQPAAIRADPFQFLLALGFSPGGLGVLFALLGLLRCGALYLNGRLPIYGPRARALGALMGAAIWAEMLASLFSLSFAHGTISIGVAVFGPLAFGDLTSCYRAAADVRSHDG